MRKHFDQPQSVGCLVVLRDRFLILHRLIGKKFGGTWGLPAGKLMPNESPAQAVAREVEEETGIDVLPTDLLELGGDTTEAHGSFRLYKVIFRESVEVHINPEEHDQYKWVTYEELNKMPNIITGLKDMLNDLGKDSVI